MMRPMSRTIRLLEFLNRLGIDVIGLNADWQFIPPLKDCEFLARLLRESILKSNVDKSRVLVAKEK